MTSLPGTRRHSAMFSSTGTTTNGNTRTPRRVQWAVDDDARVEGRKEASSHQKLCGLDELGLDPTAFETLRNALEQHQTGERFQNEGRPPDGKIPLSKPPQAVVPLRVITSNLATQRNSFVHSPVPSSGHLPAHTNAYKLYPATSAPQVQASGARTVVSSSIHSSPTDDIHSPATLIGQHTYDVPGEAWIESPEREGLPPRAPTSNVGDRATSRGALGRRSIRRQGSGDSCATFTEDYIDQVSEHQAAEVAGARTRLGWWFHRRQTNFDTENGFTDGEFHRPGRMRKAIPASWVAHHGQRYGPNLGNGVLSALLALHDHTYDYDDASSMSRESISSNAGYQADILPEPHRARLHNQDDSLNFSRTQNDVNDEYPGEFNLRRSRKGESASSILGHIRSPSRPATTTTAALLVGAGALSGVAAPQHATLVPNLKRPGYNLVRYSIEAVPKETSRGPNIIARGLRRAYSTDSGIATTDDRAGEEKEGEVESPGGVTNSILVSPAAHSDGGVPRPKRGQTYPPLPGERKGWASRLKNIPPPLHLSATNPRACPSPYLIAERERGLDTPVWSGTVTPQTGSADYTPIDEPGEKKCRFDLKRIERETKRIEERERKERQKQREKEMRRKRRKAEVYITRHVAEILQRQDFIIKLARAMIMFGGPSHRLASQIQSTGRVLDLELSCMYLPDVMLISFEDSTTGTSNVKLIRQGTALDLEKLGEAHSLYWDVIHDNMSVSAASTSLNGLMRKKPLYNFLQMTVIGGLCSASICSVSFSGSFIDCLISAPLGGLLVAIQQTAVRNELYAHVFEITIAMLLSFLSAALASAKHLCYSAVVSSSVVLILPGYIVLSGSLELSSRSLVAGAVRVCFAVMYSLFLGFGLAIGADMYTKIVGQPTIGLTDYKCAISHDPAGPWWQRTPSLRWAFLTVPMYSLFLSMRLMAPWWKKEIVICIAIASMGWVTNHFVGIKFPNQSDISAAAGAFVVGFVSNMYGRFFNGNAFVVMITGILFQVPSGLGKGGLLNFASDQTQGSSRTFVSGFHTSLQLISVALGLTVGLGISLVVVHPVQSRRRAGGLFSL